MLLREQERQPPTTKHKLRKRWPKLKKDMRSIKLNSTESKRSKRKDTKMLLEDNKSITKKLLPLKLLLMPLEEKLENNNLSNKKPTSLK